MSIHPSLTLSDKDKKQRSVLKRIERIKILMEKGKWKEGNNVYGLPKVKTLRIKIKKEKAEKVEAPATTTEAPAPAGTSESKEQVATKGTATTKGQDQDKK